MDSSMTGDFEVAPLEMVEIWKHAKIQRRRLWADEDRVDLLSLQAATDVWTIDGMRAFQLRFVADEAMSGETGLTVIEGDMIVVRLPAGMRHKLDLGLGSARLTLARELGYATLHPARLADRVPSDRLERSWIYGSGSSRWQARFFAPALLINDATAWSTGNVRDVSIAAGIDLDAAQQYLAELCGDLLRTDRGARIQTIADEVRMALPARLARYLQPQEAHANDAIRNSDAEAEIGETRSSPERSAATHDIDRTELNRFQIRAIAKEQRRRLGWNGREGVDPLELADCTEIWTMDGVAPFRLEFSPGEMDQTEYVNGTLVARISDRTRQAALFGDGRARIAIARRIAGAALAHHRRKANFQVEGRYPNMSEASLQAGRNQFEADIFASALMIEDEIALQLRSVEQVSLGAGIDHTVLLHYFHLLFQEGRLKPD
ncbi:hypothetical protein ABID60_001278 [Bradyrhizobium sp. S3.5.5]